MHWARYLVTPVVFLVVFYCVYGYLAFEIYGLFHGGAFTLLLLPRIFWEAFGFYLLLAVLVSIAPAKLRNSIVHASVPGLLLVYIVQFFSLYYFGDLVTKEMVNDVSGVTIFANSSNFLLALPIFAVVGLYACLIAKDRHVINASLACVSAFSLAFLSYYSYQRVSQDWASNHFVHTRSLELSTLALLQKDNRPDRLLPGELEKLDARYQMNFSHSERPVASDSGNRLNVVLLFVESLSAELIPPYNDRLKFHTPALDRFSKNAIKITGYKNHTSPTFQGVLGQLTSDYPQPWRTNTRRSLISHLNKHQYHTAIVSYENRAYPLPRALQNLAFKQALYKQDVETLLDTESPRVDYLSDDQVFDGMVSLIGQMSHQKPFFLVGTTVGTHIGFKAYPETTDMHPIHEAVINFDRAFGKFLVALEQQSYEKDTMIIITADHSLPYSPHTKSILSQPEHKHFDDVVLLIRHPHRFEAELQTRSNSIDLSPTILDLLNLEQPDHFLGRSLFEHRERTRLVFSSNEQLFIKEASPLTMSPDDLLNRWYKSH